jgi:hypothetical protein
MNEPDETPWETMRVWVAGLLEGHPLLGDIPCAPAVEANRVGVRLVCGGWMVTVVSPDWYLPLTEDRARLIALNLAVQARERYDEGVA